MTIVASTQRIANQNAVGHGPPGLATGGAPLVQDGPIPQPALIDGRPPRILLVDDEPLNIKVVRKYLTGAGYFDFCSTTNPAEVLPTMIRNEPDIVLLDIVMPGFTGLDILSAIRADEQLTHIPVVMLTALEDRDTKCQALWLGATDFLVLSASNTSATAVIRPTSGMSSPARPIG